MSIFLIYFRLYVSLINFLDIIQKQSQTQEIFYLNLVFLPSYHSKKKFVISLSFIFVLKILDDQLLASNIPFCPFTNKYFIFHPMLQENKSPITDQQKKTLISTYISQYDWNALIRTDFSNQIKEFNVPIIIKGVNKAGKSLLCNQLMDFKILEEGQGRNITLRALCPINVNPMTALPVMFRYNSSLDGHFLLGERNIFSGYKQQLENAQEFQISLKSYEKIQKKMIFIRQKIKELESLKVQLSTINPEDPLRLSEQEKISELQKSVDKYRMLCIQSKFNFFEGPKSRLNDFISFIDTVGSDDQASMKSQVSRGNEQRCQIYCMDLIGGFNQTHTQTIKKLYKDCSNPQNILFSFNLSNYVKYSRNYSITNLNDFLDQFLSIIPGQFLNIFKGLSDNNQCQFFKNSIQLINQYLELIKKYKREQLKKLSELNNKLHKQIIDAFPFHLIRFHGKGLIHKASQEKILMQVFVAGKERLNRNLKRSIKNSLSSKLSSLQKSREELLIEIIKKIDLAISKQQLSKLMMCKILNFQYRLNQMVECIINRISQKINKQKNDILLQAKKEVEQIQRVSLRQKYLYIFQATVKQDQENKLERTINRTTQKLENMLRNLKDSVNLDGLENIRQIIDRERNSEIKNMMERYYGWACNGLVDQIVNQSKEFINRYNIMLEKAKLQAKDQCDLNINPNMIDPAILNAIADTLKILFSAMLVGLTITGKVALKLLGGTLGSAVVLGAYLVQGLATHFSRKKEDSNWLLNVYFYKTFLRQLSVKYQEQINTDFKHIPNSKSQSIRVCEFSRNMQSLENSQQVVKNLQKVKRILKQKQKGQLQQWKQIMNLLL